MPYFRPLRISGENSLKYSSHSQIAPPQIAPSPEIAPVFRAGIVVQFGDLAQKHYQIEVFLIIQTGGNKTFIDYSAKGNFTNTEDYKIKQVALYKTS